MALCLSVSIVLKVEMLSPNNQSSNIPFLIPPRDLEEAIFAHQDARCIILKSSTPGMFCAGADLKERKGMSPKEIEVFKTHMNATFNTFEALPCPTISMIDGPALGGGLELALCSDIRIVTKDALIGLTETSLAIIPGAGGTQRCPRLIGVSKAKELIFTAEKFKGEKALQLGLVNHCVENREAGEAKAMEIAEKIGANGPIAVRQAKRAINYGINMDLKSGLEFEEACYAKLYHTEDRLEALKAFAEKRKPNYQGK